MPDRAVYFGEAGVTTRAVLLLAFIFLTARISAHMIARAAYIVGVPLREGTRVDDLRGRCDPGNADPMRPNAET